MSSTSVGVRNGNHEIIMIGNVAEYNAVKKRISVKISWVDDDNKLTMTITDGNKPQDCPPYLISVAALPCRKE